MSILKQSEPTDAERPIAILFFGQSPVGKESLIQAIIDFLAGGGIFEQFGEGIRISSSDYRNSNNTLYKENPFLDEIVSGIDSRFHVFEHEIQILSMVHFLRAHIKIGATLEQFIIFDDFLSSKEEAVVLEKALSNYFCCREIVTIELVSEENVLPALEFFKNSKNCRTIELGYTKKDMIMNEMFYELFDHNNPDPFGLLGAH